MTYFNMDEYSDSRSETAKRRWQLAGIHVCTVCMHKKEPQKPPEHASEHVKPQNFLGACPQTPLAQSMLWAPLFVFALGPSHPLSGPAWEHTYTI